ncbi:MAG: tyrosine recombinase XerC [Clostridia bacterium]|nr:tyrosine recombinase XerC [Clostridia bacterium]
MSTEYNPDEYSEILRDFANYKAVIQGCSPRTINEYMLDIRSFCRFLKAKKKGVKYTPEEGEDYPVCDIGTDFLAAVKPSDIYDFLFFCERVCKNAPAARARKLSAIKGLYKYLTVKRSLIDDNPAADVESPKKRQSLPKFLTYEESVKLLTTVRNDPTAKPPSAALRNYTIITLFLNCGMRLSELTGINMSDIDREFRSVRVIGKGNKERIIYLNDSCRSALEEYLPVRMSAEFTGTRCNALFLSSRGERMSNRAVQWTVDKYLEMAGLGYRHLSVHKLRHTAATLMYQKGGVDVRVLKEILGHEQLNTTQIYTHVSNTEIEAAMAKNPLAELSIPKEPALDATGGKASGAPGSGSDAGNSGDDANNQEQG